MSRTTYNDSGTDGTRRDIETTRARMGDTLEELGTRLNPQRLKQQAKDKIRGATIGRVQTMAQTTVDTAKSAGRSVTDSIRSNPIPAALIAAGVSWLVWSSLRSGDGADTMETSDGNRFAEPEGIETYSQDGDERVADKVRGKASDVADSVGGLAERATESTKSAAQGVADTVKIQSNRVSSAFESNPIALGVIAAALGAAAGLAIPSTTKEAELVGEKRDELIDKAREVVSEKKQQVKRVADRVVTQARSTVTQAAREEGLTGSP
jgi:hypothetical protein